MANRWQEDYKEWMNREYFSETEKEDMVKKLMHSNEDAEGKAKSGRVSGRYWTMQRAGLKGAVAACLAGCLLVTGVAGASAAGFLKPVSDVFADVFHLTDGNEKLAQKMGTSLGKSTVSNGIRVTADAMIVDKYTSALIFSVEREDGKPLGTGKKLASDSWGFDGVEVKGMEKSSGGSWGSYESYDENPTDAAIQYMMIHTYDNKMAGDKMSVCLTDLFNFASDGANKNYTIEGEWKFEIPVQEASNASVTLGADQTVRLKGYTFSIDNLELSPLSYHMTCSAKKDGGRAEASAKIDELDDLLTENPVTLELKNGRKICLDDVGSVVSDNGNRFKCTYATTFNTLIPLEDMKSIHIGETEIAVHAE